MRSRGRGVFGFHVYGVDVTRPGVSLGSVEDHLLLKPPHLGRDAGVCLIACAGTLALS